MYPDALLVGAGTLRHETYGPVRLSQERRAWREASGLPAYPVLVIVSGRLELDPQAPVLAQAPVRPIVVTCADAPADRIARLSSVADVVACGDEHVDLPAVLAALHRRGLTELLSEGGPMLFGSLTGAGLVDEVCLTVSPLLAGPGAGRITAGLAATAQGLHLAHALLEDGVLLLRYVRSDARPTPTPTPTPPPLPIAT
jgi:riboflavin biosynthesis pyrimidine reductase